MLIFFIIIISLAALAAFFMSFRKLITDDEDSDEMEEEDKIKPNIKLQKFTGELLLDVTKLYEYVNHQKFTDYQSISDELYWCIECLQQPNVSESLIQRVDEKLSKIESNLKERGLI